MSKLALVKRSLKRLGVPFQYEENKETPEKSILFSDTLGKAHQVVEVVVYWNGNPIIELWFDDKRMDNQADVTNWIENNKLLLTDAVAYQSQQEAREAQKAEINRLRKREYFKFPHGNYELTVIKNLLGNISYRIATTTNPERDMDYTPRLEVKFEGRHEDNPIVVISTGGYYEFDVEQAIYLQEALLGAIKAVEVFQKIIDKESKLPLTETK